MRPPDGVLLVLLFLLLVIAVPHVRASCDLFVSPSGFNNETCGEFTDPCFTIEHAVDEAIRLINDGLCNESADVWLFPGTYSGPGNKNIVLDGHKSNFSSFSIQAYRNSTTRRREHPHPQVLIDAEFNGTFLHVSFAAGLQQRVQLVGLAIHGTSNTGQLSCGGGLFAEGIGEVDVSNCTFVQNNIYAASQGSAICTHGVRLFVNDSRFTNNTNGALVNLNGVLFVHHTTFESNTINGGDGTAVYAYYSDVVLHDSHFANNYGLQPSVFGGATVVVQYGRIFNITECIFTINSGGRRGGAVQIGPTDEVYIFGTQFVGNNAHTGGAVLVGWEYADSAIATIVNITSCEFTGNHADLGGAVALLGATNTTAYLTNLTFSLNRADESGGAVYESLGASVFDPTVYFNCTFNDNVAQGRGGAMHLHGSQSLITNCTFTGNSAYDGGGIFAERCIGDNYTCACEDMDTCSLAVLHSTVETNQCAHIVIVTHFASAIDNGGGIFCTCKLFFGDNLIRGNEAQGELTDMACKDCTWENQNEDNLCLPDPQPAPLTPPNDLHLPWWIWVTIGLIIALVVITSVIAVMLCRGSDNEERHPLIDAPRQKKRSVIINE